MRDRLLTIPVEDVEFFKVSLELVAFVVGDSRHFIFKLNPIKFIAPRIIWRFVITR